MHLKSDTIRELTAHLAEVRERRLDELSEFIRIPSVSKDPTRLADMARAAEFVAAAGRDGAAAAEILATDGHPAVLLEWRAAESDAPTILIYAHLDVQPAEAAGFDPVVREGRVFGRGATDMKGPLLATINAIAAVRAVIGDLRLNVTMLIDGEEEIGSPSLRKLLAEHRDRLAADVALISDSMMWSADQPAICVGLRGWVGLELTVSVAPAEVASSGLHSGDFGGVAPNALQVLAAMIASLHDDAGRVSIAGFYEDVPPISADDAAALAALPDVELELCEQLGARRLVGEAGFSARERLSFRPTLEVHGFSSGYPGPGIKNAVPRQAQASLSCRMVGGQRPEQIAELVERHLRDACPDFADLDLIRHPGTPPIRLASDHPHLSIAADALRQVFPLDPLLTFAGASGTAPILLQEELGLPPILVGFSSPGENPHAADESFLLSSYDRASATLALLIAELAVR